MHYLDNAATTPVSPAVTECIARELALHFANPSSLYPPGYEAEERVAVARAAVAAAMGVTSPQDARHPTVLFTGGGTEANNIAVFGAARARKNWGDHIVATGYEHPSVDRPLRMLAQQEGFRVTLIPPRADGRVSPDEIAAAVQEKTVLVAAMQVNNETGAVLDVAALAAQVKAKNNRLYVHVDGVQAFTKLPLPLEETGIDSYAVSGHKIGAPKGVGALFLRKGLHLAPPFGGGGQEGGIRPGTENTAYIAGLAVAADSAVANRQQTHQLFSALQARLLAGLRNLDGVTVNSPADAWPGIVNFSLPAGMRSQVMLNHLAEREVYISAGSACDRGKQSHTLAAMGLPAGRIESALRVSFGPENTQEDIDALLDGLAGGLRTLSRGRPGARR